MINKIRKTCYTWGVICKSPKLGKFWQNKKMKKTIVIILAASLFAVSGIVSAEESSFSKESDKKDRKIRYQEMKEKREDIKIQRTAVKNDFQKQRELWKADRAAALEKIKSEKEKLKEMREKFTAEKCARIQERIKNRTGKYDEKAGKHFKVYTNLVNRINKFITRADAEKLDTTAIKNHLAELQAKIEKFKEDYAAYIAKLKESKNFTCGRSEGEFRGALLESKTLLKQVHADAADIRKYVRTVILPDIRALKAQMPKDADEDENKDEEETSEKSGNTTTTTTTTTTSTAPAQ